MRNLFFSIFAVAVAAVAAMTATTAMLNAPQRGGQVPVTTANVDAPQGTPPASQGKPAPGTGGAAETPGATPGAKPPGGASDPAADTNAAEEADKDPYEGIPEEELPPDLQYSADSSVSFPTNI